MKSEFIISCSDPKKFPVHNYQEYAFVGRSNVGKSSLINSICLRKNLAKTSSTPGKTQLVNFFQINERWMLVDLPGIGYARISKKTRARWESIISQYILKREYLTNVFMLIDIRLKPQPIDIEFINWMGENGIPFSLVFTKCDKVSETLLVKNIEAYKNFLHQWWVELPELFITSAETKRGREELLAFIEKTNKG